ncbi:transposase [Fibrella rubiginis]|uniref:transposase n=1 Tax=Fibrella rubiginis TaxID=2817060 RepID=UPI001E5396FC|nr:transposase [Fibrella rubiginis]
MLRTGCQWRNLPPQWPHWQAVYYYFDQWKQTNLWAQINAALNEVDRQSVGRTPLPSAFCIDSQSVKLHPMIWEDRGFDSHKCVNGRKRQLIVDTQGRIWVVGVHAAQQGDGPAAIDLVGDLLWRVGERVEKVFGDQAYNGVFARELDGWGRCAGAIEFEKASRPPWRGLNRPVVLCR